MPHPERSWLAWQVGCFFFFVLEGRGLIGWLEGGWLAFAVDQRTDAPTQTFNMLHTNTQMPWMPRGAAMVAAGEGEGEQGQAEARYSPWFRLFQNAYAFSMAAAQQQQQ